MPQALLKYVEHYLKYVEYDLKYVGYDLKYVEQYLRAGTRPAPAIGETTIDNVTVLYCVRRCAKNRILL